MDRLVVRRELILMAACALLPGCAESGIEQEDRQTPQSRDVAAITTDSSDELSSAKHIAAGYKQLQLVTDEPVEVDAQLSLLCVGVYQQHIDQAAKKTGPHAYTKIQIFMNDAAATTFAAKQVPYPVGSIVVKEKQGQSYSRNRSEPNNGLKTHDGVGGMIKRAAGYDPANGDWEYFYFEDPAKIEAGKIASCIDCHRGAKDRGFVFGDWAGAKLHGVP